MPPYLDTNQWSTTHHVQVGTVNRDTNAAANGSHPIFYQITEQTHFTKANLQKKLLSEYKRNSKNKSQEYAKFLADKKSLITIFFGQCDEATQTKIALRATYTADRNAERLLAFIE